MTKPFTDQEDDFSYDKDFFDEFFSEEEDAVYTPVETIEEPENNFVEKIQGKEEDSSVEEIQGKEEDNSVEEMQEEKEDNSVEKMQEKAKNNSAEEMKEKTEPGPVKEISKKTVEKTKVISEKVIRKEPAKKVANKQTKEKPIEVPIPFARKKRKGLVFSLAVIALCIMAFAGFIFFNEHMTYASVYLSINPTVRIDVNKKDQVINVEGVNTDGTSMIENYNWDKKEIKTVVDELLDRAIEMGYLVEGGTIKLTLDSSHSDWIQNHRDSLNELVNRHLTGLSSDMNIQVEMEEIDSSASTQSGIFGGNDSDEDSDDDRNDNQNRPDRDENNAVNNDGNTTEDGREDGTTVGNVADNTTDEDTSGNNTVDEDTSSDNTTDENTSSDNTTDEDTSSDNTTDENTSSDNTTDENTSGDNTTDENTSGDNTTDENTSGDNTTDEGSSDDTTEDDNEDDSASNVGNGGMIIVPNSVEEEDSVEEDDSVGEGNSVEDKTETEGSDN